MNVIIYRLKALVNELLYENRVNCFSERVMNENFFAGQFRL